MSCSKPQQTCNPSGSEINDLPNEILEYIFSHLCPYSDYKNAMLVSKRWHKIIQGVQYHSLSSFHQAIHTGALNWETLSAASGPSITERYAHSACYYNKSLYVFGGCTSTSTTFNDLWRLDLATGEWIRPLATGSYPSPKACATLVLYEKNLLLFGGWSHPTPYTFHQASKFFNQLHSYRPDTNRWLQIVTPDSPCGKAGHGATVVSDSMVVFGGYHAHNVSSNQVWVLDLKEENWSEVVFSGTNKPLPRYGHSQTLIDKNHILVVGGCGGPNKQLSDAWLMDMTHEPWFWTKIDIVNLQNAAHQLWCHPACMVGDKIVVVSKNTRMNRSGYQPAGRGTSLHQKPSHDHRLCSVGSRAHFKRTHPETSESSSQESSSDTDDGAPKTNRDRSPKNSSFHKGASRSSSCSKSAAVSASPAALSSDTGAPVQCQKTPDGSSMPLSLRLGMPSVRPNATRNRQKQLETLKWYEHKIKQMSKPENNPPLEVCEEPQISMSSTNPMYVHVLDISTVLTQSRAVWLPVQPSESNNIPEETVFYSIVQGRGEVIIFGGIQMDLNSMQKGLGNNSHQQASKAVYFLRAPKTLR